MPPLLSAVTSAATAVAMTLALGYWQMMARYPVRRR